MDHEAGPLPYYMGGSVNEKTSCRTLIVEDDPASRETLAAFLRRRGYAVQCASNVADGGSKLTGRVTHLILDLRLPDGSGLKLLEAVKQQDLSVKVAVITGAEKTDLLADAVMLQPDAFLKKPVDFLDVLAWIEGERPSLSEFLAGDASPHWRA